MARTTNEKKGKTVIVRISDELHERLMRESSDEGVSMSEYARGILSGERKCNTESEELRALKEENSVLQKEIEHLREPKINEPENNVIQNKVMSDATYRDLEDMCMKSGLSVSKFFDRICELFNEGDIYMDGLVVKARGKYDVRELEDVCHRTNADPQDMINKLVKSLLRG